MSFWSEIIFGGSLKLFGRTKNIKRRAYSIVWVMGMVITLETIHKDVQLVRRELHTLKCLLESDGELTNEACHKLQKAREEMDKGKYISHEKVRHCPVHR